MALDSSKYLQHAWRPLLRYAEFRGRSDRAEYWSFTIGLFLTFIAVATLFGWFASLFRLSTEGGLIGALATLVFGAICIVTFIPSLAVTVRRLHDGGRSGWFCLLSLVPAVGGLLLLLLLALPGEAEANDYGPPPSAEAPFT
ncbi:MAG: DUF805 domain-containing protein [Pseudomonadales bacterium]